MNEFKQWIIDEAKLLRDEIEILRQTFKQLHIPLVTPHAGSREWGRVIYLTGNDISTLECVAAGLILANHVPVIPRFDLLPMGSWELELRMRLHLIHRVDGVLMHKGWERNIFSVAERYCAYSAGRTVWYTVRDIPSA